MSAGVPEHIVTRVQHRTVKRGAVNPRTSSEGGKNGGQNEEYKHRAALCATG